MTPKHDTSEGTHDKIRAVLDALEQCRAQQGELRAHERHLLQSIDKLAAEIFPEESGEFSFLDGTRLVSIAGNSQQASVTIKNLPSLRDANE